MKLGLTSSTRRNVVIEIAPPVHPAEDSETELPAAPIDDTLAPASQVSIKQTRKVRKAKPPER